GPAEEGPSRQGSGILGNPRKTASRIFEEPGSAGEAGRETITRGPTVLASGEWVAEVMAIIVIGGQSRDVGKTSVVAGLISALPEYNWTAFKITQFGHGRCSLDGKPCTCATDDRCFAMTEEKDPASKSDTSRFLAAGAKRAFWVRTE